ncbi:Guanine Nucleotide Exchange Factor Vav2 [Manis pentadactyla]|nr:Guanine Nucleotide Exchange Factor Vav2 [Manis pentadactyla]
MAISSSGFMILKSSKTFLFPTRGTGRERERENNQPGIGRKTNSLLFNWRCFPQICQNPDINPAVKEIRHQSLYTEPFASVSMMTALGTSEQGQCVDLHPRTRESAPSNVNSVPTDSVPGLESLRNHSANEATPGEEIRPGTASEEGCLRTLALTEAMNGARVSDERHSKFLLMLWPKERSKSNMYMPEDRRARTANDSKRGTKRKEAQGRSAPKAIRKLDSTVGGKWGQIPRAFIPRNTFPNPTYHVASRKPTFTSPLHPEPR